MKTNAPRKVATNLALDAKSFLLAVVAEIQASINFVYPGSTFAESRAHAALQSIRSSTASLKAFLESLHEVSSEPEPPEETPDAVYLVMDQKGQALFEGTRQTIGTSKLAIATGNPKPTQDELLKWTSEQNLSLYRKLL